MSDKNNAKRQYDIYSAGGMTMRQWYKGMALIGYIMADPLRNDPARVAEYAGQNADAMLSEDAAFDARGK